MRAADVSMETAMLLAGRDDLRIWGRVGEDAGGGDDEDDGGDERRLMSLARRLAMSQGGTSGRNRKV